MNSTEPKAIEESAQKPSTSSQPAESAIDAEPNTRPSVSQESSVDCEDEQSINREDNKIYMENYQYGFDANDTLTQERNEIEKAIKNQQITPGRAKLQLWLYRSMRIVMTDGRILIGIFLCTDSDANVILGVCSEYTKNGGDERMLGLVMVPGKQSSIHSFIQTILMVFIRFCFLQDDTLLRCISTHEHKLQSVDAILIIIIKKIKKIFCFEVK